MDAAKMVHTHVKHTWSYRGQEYFKMFRIALSHYAQKMVLPYLILPGPCEIDESKVIHRNFQCGRGYYANQRWMFGIYCRKTRMQVIYSIKEKIMPTLTAIMKKHIPPGVMVFSDQHMSYCNMQQGISKLSSLGFFHMWTNHSYRMVHEKFPFNHSLNVERGWHDIKKSCCAMRKTQEYEKIQEFCDMFLIKRRIVRRSCLYDFTLRCLH
jgi:hypothetical protein